MDALHQVSTDKFVAVFAGRDHACAILENGRLGVCWGNGDGGALGDGTLKDSRVPVAIDGGLVWGTFALGARHTCARDQGDALWCWGQNLRGQVGTPNALEMRPVPLMADRQWTSIATGDQHTCGISNGELRCWGSNRDGQLGTGLNWRPTFVVVPQPD